MSKTGRKGKGGFLSQAEETECTKVLRHVQARENLGHYGKSKHVICPELKLHVERLASKW